MDPILLKLLETGDASAIIDYIDWEADQAAWERKCLIEEYREQHGYSRIEG